MKLLKYIFILFFALFISGRAKAQCDTIADLCTRHIINTFVSDGQQYRALLLNPNETAEFTSTFFGGTTYRIAACSGMSDGNLVFSIFDQEKNLLFTNANYKNAPYWDFKVKSTLEITIEAHLDKASSGSGCAVILIGFRQ